MFSLRLAIFGGLVISIVLLNDAAHAQATVRPCVTTSATECPAVSSNNPLPITGTVTATTTPGNAVGITPTDRTITSATGGTGVAACSCTGRALPVRHRLSALRCISPIEIEGGQTA